MISTKSENNTLHNDANSLSSSHFIINYDLATLTLLPNVSVNFIYFIKELFNEFNYNFEIESFSYGPLTKKQYDTFYQMLESLIGNELEFLNKSSKEQQQKIVTLHLDSIISTIKLLAINYKQVCEIEDKLQSSLSKNNQIFSKLLLSKSSNSTNYDPLTDNKYNKKNAFESYLEDCSSLLKDTKNTKVQNKQNVEPFDVTPYETNSNFFFLDNYWEKDGVKDNITYTHLSVLYYEEQQVTLIIQDDKLNYICDLIKYFKGFKVIKEYKKIFNNTAKELKEYFHLREFPDFETANNKLNSYETLYDINKYNNSNENSLNDIVVGYIKSYYNINNDPKLMIKASILLEKTEQALAVDRFTRDPSFRDILNDKIKFRKQLSDILLNLGLKKKRLSSGIYYYGIECKDPRFYLSVSNTDASTTSSDITEVLNSCSSSSKTKDISSEKNDKCLSNLISKFSPPNNSISTISNDINEILNSFSSSDNIKDESSEKKENLSEEIDRIKNNNLSDLSDFKNKSDSSNTFIYPETDKVTWLNNGTKLQSIHHAIIQKIYDSSESSESS